MPKPARKPPSTVTPARFEAFTILIEVERGKAYADDLLRGPRVSALPAQDRHLCTTLVMGTLRWQIQLDALIKKFLSRPNARLDPAIRVALRLGALQLQHFDRIPAHAAINESVSLARLAGHQFASGMVNAVLRMVSSEPKTNPDPESAYPNWLVERWTRIYGSGTTHAICEQGQQQPELTLRLPHPNPDPESAPNLETELAGQGIDLRPGVILTAARRVASGDITPTEALRTGKIRIQEEGSQLIAELAGSGTSILDACAAPGGKTLILAERNPQAKVIAFEISPQRSEMLKARMAASPDAARIELRQADSTGLTSDPYYDLILADVPCSGTGTLGRNPEIRHRLQPEDLARHHERQCAILRGALRAGTRRVVYSTCSLEPEENSGVVAEVLTSAPNWRQIPVSELLHGLKEQGRLAPDSLEALQKGIAPDGSLTILPGSLGPEIQTDGFFIAVLEKANQENLKPTHLATVSATVDPTSTR